MIVNFADADAKKKTLTLPPFWLKFVKFSTDARAVRNCAKLVDPLNVATLVFN